MAQAHSYELALTAAGAWLEFNGGQESVGVKLIGASRQLRMAPEQLLPGRGHYFIGTDPRKWRTNVVSYARVRYHNVYPGIDLVFYGTGEQLEFDFIVAPGARPSVIRLELNGAGHLRLNRQGELVLGGQKGRVQLGKPVVYQEVHRERRRIPGRWRIEGRRRVSFRVGRYDRSQPLVIDPVLRYYTSVTTLMYATGWDLAVDPEGNAYVAGVAGIFSNKSRPEAFVAKLNPAGSELVYFARLSGSRGAEGQVIAIDGSGNAYVAGAAHSEDFPTTPGAFRSAGANTFVAKLDLSGNLLYSALLGEGSVGGIAVDRLGSAYICGSTSSESFPMHNPLQGSYRGGSSDAFVSKLTPAGSALVYSTYLGGNRQDQARSVAVDSAGNART